MENSNSLGGARIALLIDFDNVILGIDDPGFDVELVVNALRERGTIVVSRVYGDWYRHSRHRRKLMEHGLELVEAPAFGPVIKNSADIKIALDGLELGMTQPHINTFCLVSGDSDFLPLIKKLQGLGKNVLVICGNRFTSDMLRRNCNEFISYENLLAASYGADEDATTIEGAFALLHRAMAALRERGSEIRTSTLKQMMIQLNPVFSEKTFGYNQFRGFLDKAGREGLIKLGPRDRVSGEFYVLLPAEDEAEVIEQIERAESAEVVEEIVEARKGNGRNRRGEKSKSDEERAPRFSDKSQDKLANRDAQRADEAEPSRPRSRREARLAALREQQEAQQKSPAVAPVQPAAPLATPLTPATDFSPADAQETSELSISRRELLSRGLRPGRVRFSGKSGKVESLGAAPNPTIEDQAPAVETERPEADIALSPADAGVEDVSAAPVVSDKPVADAQTDGETAEAAPENPTPEAQTSEAQTPEAPTAAQTPETPEAPETEAKSKRSRSRRRRKTAETETASDEAAPPLETAAEETAEVPTASETAAAATPDAESSEAPAAQPKRSRRRSKVQAEAAPATDETPAADAAEEETAMDEKTTEDAPLAAEKPKVKRPRRRKQTDDAPEPPLQAPAIETAATEPDAPVSTAALIEASADTPVAEAPKTRRRRASRKQAEEAAQAEAEVGENIVTGDQTTGEVSPAELAQIPTPNSEDEP